MALIGQHGGKLLAVFNTNTYASNGGHDGSNGGDMLFDFYLPTDIDDTKTFGTNTADVELILQEVTTGVTVGKNF